MKTRRTRTPWRAGSRALLTGLVLLTSLAAVPTAPARAQDPGGTSGDNVQGNTYTSPDFGYAISWDNTWDATDDTEDSNPTYNSLQLENGASTVLIQGSDEEIEPVACIETVVAAIADVPDASEPVLVEDDLGGDLPSATYTIEYGNEQDGVVEITVYARCETILDGTVLLNVVHLAQTSDYEDEVAEREDLLGNLALDGSIPEVEPDEPSGGDDPNDDGQAPDTGDAGSSTINQASVPRGDGDLPSNADDLVELIDGSILDINNYWAREFPLLSGGDAYVPPTEWVTWTGSVDTGCGPAESFGEDAVTEGVGPFYCPPDETIYYDLNFANIQLQIVENQFVIPVVMAHELGHHIQTRLGLEVCAETPCLDSDLLTSQEIEYMADCWAGAWAQDAELRGRLGSGDIDDNIAQYSIILGGGFESADIGSHGRGAERVWWFLNGYLEGGARCLDTSQVTAGLADDPTTPEPDPTTPDDPTTPEPDAPTPDDPTTPDDPAGTTAALEEVVDLVAYTFEALDTSTRDAIDTEEPDEGSFVIVYFRAEIADDGDGPFDYASWTLVDGSGTSYDVDENATNQLLSTNYADGVEEDLASGKGYFLAMVFDVPADAEGLSLVNADASVTIDLAI